MALGGLLLSLRPTRSYLTIPSSCMCAIATVKLRYRRNDRQGLLATYPVMSATVGKPARQDALHRRPEF